MTVTEASGSFRGISIRYKKVRESYITEVSNIIRLSFLCLGVFVVYIHSFYHKPPKAQRRSLNRLLISFFWRGRFSDETDQA